MPYLWPSDGTTRDDVVVPPHSRDQWLHQYVVVEEKLDGANTTLWRDKDGQIRVAARGGADAMDRSRQLGRLRAYAAERHESVGALAGDGWVLYGEWLWLTHTVHYDRLPDWLIALDLWCPESGFSSVAQRNDRCLSAGVQIPPRLFAGILGSAERLLSLLGPSAYSSSDPVEGVVLRREDGQRCKILRPGFVRRSDEDWRMSRRHNALAEAVSRRAMTDA
jgi:RNA ligase